MTEYKPGDQVRLLIVKLKRRGDKAELWGRGHRYRDTILFDLSELLTVGIDPQALVENVETTCRFWAVCTVSEKRTSKDNPYLDVAYLEPAGDIAGDQAAARVDLEQVLGPMRTLYGMLKEIKNEIAVLRGDVLANTEQIENLERLFAAQDGQPEPQPVPTLALEPAPAAEPEPALSPAQATTPETESPPLDDDEARVRFGKKVGPAIRAGQIKPDTVNDLTAQVAVRKISWGDAYRQLCQKIDASRV